MDVCTERDRKWDPRMGVYRWGLCRWRIQNVTALFEVWNCGRRALAEVRDHTQVWGGGGRGQRVSVDRGVGMGREGGGKIACCLM